MKIIRSQTEIDDVLNRCVEADETGASKYPGMLYEHGAKNMWEWLTGETDALVFE